MWGVTSGVQGAKTSSSILACSSAYSSTHSLMSAYTLNSGDREKQSPSTLSRPVARSFLSNQSCRLITGIPSSSRSWLKNGSLDHPAGRILLKTSTGIADT